MPVPKNSKQKTRISAKDIVFNQLQKWIVEGNLRSGERINDDELAETLGVSRTPVREALQILETNGSGISYIIVNLANNKGLTSIIKNLRMHPCFAFKIYFF
nr:GntR family transcriptional regulator [Bacillus vallismortis]